jgi:hypothetical protein
MMRDRASKAAKCLSAVQLDIRQRPFQLSKKDQASGKAEPLKGAKEKKPVSAAVVKEVVDSTEGRGRVIGGLIENVGEFRTAWEQNSNDSAKSLFLFLVAAYNYVHKDKVKGEAMVTVVYSEKALWTDPKSPTGFKLSVGDRQFMEQLAGMPEVVDSYLGGHAWQRLQGQPDALGHGRGVRGILGRLGNRHYPECGQGFRHTV